MREVATRLSRDVGARKVTCSQWHGRHKPVERFAFQKTVRASEVGLLRSRLDVRQIDCFGCCVAASQPHIESSQSP